MFDGNLKPRLPLLAGFLNTLEPQQGPTIPVTGVSIVRELKDGHFSIFGSLIQPRLLDSHDRQRQKGFQVRVSNGHTTQKSITSLFEAGRFVKVSTFDARIIGHLTFQLAKNKGWNQQQEQGQDFNISEIIQQEQFPSSFKTARQRGQEREKGKVWWVWNDNNHRKPRKLIRFQRNWDQPSPGHHSSKERYRHERKRETPNSSH